MFYTLAKFLLWALLIGVIGGVIGWLLRGLRCAHEHADRAEELDRLRSRDHDGDGATDGGAAVSRDDAVAVGAAQTDVLSTPTGDHPEAGDAHDRESTAIVTRTTDEHDLGGVFAAGAAAAAAGDTTPTGTTEEDHAPERLVSEESRPVPGSEPAVGADPEGSMVGSDSPDASTTTSEDADEGAGAMPGFAGTPSSTAAEDPPDLDAAREALGKRVKLNDLKIVEGIGPKIAGLMNDDGITTWAELAAAPLDRLERILSDAGSNFRLADPGTWSQQAGLAANGDWAALKRLQGELDAGRG